MNQRGAVQAEPVGRTLRSADHPARRVEGPDDERTFGIPERRCGRSGRDARRSWRRQGIGQHAIIGQDDRTLDEVLQLANVPGQS